MRRGIGALFVAFLAVRVLTAPPPAPSQPAETTAQPAGKTSPLRARARSAAEEVKQKSLPEGQGPCEKKSEDCPPKGLLDAFDDSLKPSAPDLELIARVQELITGSRNPRFLIATVPDPVHTHLSLFFDRQVVAIEEAVQQAGYLFSRAYLPWDNVQHPEDTDFRVRLKQEDYQGKRENYPGVLVFHFRESLVQSDSENKSQAQKDQLHGPLLVFLVAETPTGGISRQQFRNAIAAMEGICKRDCDQSIQKTGELSILGPTFSGSFYSLRDILLELKETLRSVVIHSGSASDNQSIRWFGDLQKQSFPVKVKFRTFVEGNDYALRYFFDFVCSEGYHSERIAVLSEDETAYGAGGSSAETCRDGGGPVLHLFFPRDISALRNAYQQDAKVSAAGSSSVAPRSTLSLNLGDHGSDDDSVAIYSADQSPLSEEGVMMGIVSDLREHRTNLVVIEATNPLDTVFLVRYLRAAYPDARLITVGSDLLLPRQVDDPRLRGVMQVSSYSLIPEIDRYIATVADQCSQPSFLNRIFPSDYSVGTFNAVLSLMEFQGTAAHGDKCKPAPPTDTGSDSAQNDHLISSAYVQYGWPAVAGASAPSAPIVPPLWLTVQGHDQFWPVELLDGPGRRNDASGHQSLLHAIWPGTFRVQAPEQVSLPASWIVTSSSGIALAIAIAFLMWRGSIRTSSTLLANFAHVDELWRNVTLAAGALVTFDILVCLLWPEFWFSGPLRWVILLCVGIVFLAIAADLWRRGQCVLVVPSLLIGIGSVYALNYAFGSGPEIKQNLMRYRYAHLASGVSPVSPFLLLLAAFLWALWHRLSGRSPWDVHGTGPEMPDIADVNPRPSPGVKIAADRLRLSTLTSQGNEKLLKAMTPSQINWRILVPSGVACLLLTLTGVVPSVPHRIQSFEGPEYDLVYTVLVIVVIFFLLKDTFCVGWIWLELRRLLQALDRLPLRRGFARISGFNSKGLWQLGGSRLDDYFGVLSKEIQTVTSLANEETSYGRVPDEWRRVSADIAQFGWWLRNQIPGDKWSKAATYDSNLAGGLIDTQSTLAGTCAAVLKDLNDTWNEEARSVWDAECIERQKSQCDETGLRAAVLLREDFVCLFYLNFISSVFARMRALVLTIAGLFVFLLLSFNSYPFESSSRFHTAMIFLFAFVVVVVGIVYGQADKNATLSRITATKAGELGWEFWLRLASFVAVPLLSLLAVKFPEISGFLFSWLEPASQAFR